MRNKTEEMSKAKRKQAFTAAQCTSVGGTAGRWVIKCRHLCSFQLGSTFLICKIESINAGFIDCYGTK